MCQKIVTILWKDNPDEADYQRNTCPDHPSSKLRRKTGCGECGWDFCGGIGRVKFAISNKKEPINVNGLVVETCPVHNKFLRVTIGCPDCHFDFLPEIQTPQAVTA